MNVKMRSCVHLVEWLSYCSLCFHIRLYSWSWTYELNMWLMFSCTTLTSAMFLLELNPPSLPLTKITWHETLHFMCYPTAISKKKTLRNSWTVSRLPQQMWKSSIIDVVKTVVSLRQSACYKFAERLVNSYQITGRHFPTYGTPRNQTVAADCHARCLQ